MAFLKAQARRQTDAKRRGAIPFDTDRRAFACGHGCGKGCSSRR
jgi:hypothetical protein